MSSEQATMSHTAMLCEARDYGDCYLHTELFDVTFQYRDAKGRHQPDEVVKVCMCKGHYNWLSKIHQGEPLKMQGEVAKYAVHDGLFADFADKKHMYTLMNVRFEEEADGTQPQEFQLFNGRDVDAMRQVIREWYPNKGFISIYEEGFFQTTVHKIPGTEEKYEQVIIEVKSITGELALDALASELLPMNIMTPELITLNINDSSFTFVPRAETDPLYVNEPKPLFFLKFFQKKQAAAIYINFEECVEFIENEIDDENIINWSELREKSPHKTEQALFEKSQQLTNALLRDDDGASIIVTEMLDDAEISADVLWITYITANHHLFASSDPKKNLKNNKALVDLFILFGLKKNLLTLAISGQRERMLFSKRRAHYNILYENEFVVKYLVPKFISGTDIIYKTEYVANTPLEYWNNYDNVLCYMGGGPRSNMDETFEKNEEIRLYLELNTSATEVPATEVPATEEPATEEPSTEEKPPLIGKLDPNVLSAQVLPYYNKVHANGYPDAEFVILGYKSLFDYRLCSDVDLTKCSAEECEKLLPGFIAKIEEKKRKLRAGDYEEWQKINATILSYKYKY